MNRRELDEMFEKAEIIPYEQAWYESLGYTGGDRTTWYCNLEYEWIPEDWLRPGWDKVRVVPMTVKEVEDWIGSASIAGADIDFDEAAAYWKYIDVARVEPRY